MSDLPNINVFVDECGTNELDSSKDSVSQLFICIAILAEDDDLNSLNEAIRMIQKRFCGGGELKSKNIASNMKRRLEILNELKNLPFRFFALVINKDNVSTDSPLQYKQTFYKFINRMLFQRLSAKGACLRVYADRIGSIDFMDSFTAYFNRLALPDLFSGWDHDFVDSRNVPLVQVADFVAGSLGYCYDKKKKGEHSSEINEILYPQCIGIEVWPHGRIELPETLPLDNEEIDKRLNAILNNAVVEFIDKYEDSDDIHEQMQAFVLRELYIAAREYDDKTKRSIYADALIKRLHESGFEEMNRQNFAARIIGKLRDSGIILCGSSLGYRVALSLADINDYMEHDRNIIEPMLHRLQKARENVKTVTPRGYDILSKNGCENLRAFVDILVSQRNSVMMQSEVMADEENELT